MKFKAGQKVRVADTKDDILPWYRSGDTGNVLSVDREVVKVFFDPSPTVQPPGVWYVPDIDLEIVDEKV